MARRSTKYHIWVSCNNSDWHKSLKSGDFYQMYTLPRRAWKSCCQQMSFQACCWWFKICVGEIIAIVNNRPWFTDLWVGSTIHDWVRSAWWPISFDILFQNNCQNGKTEPLSVKWLIKLRFLFKEKHPFFDQLNSLNWRWKLCDC